jgi:hypothetical protein
MSNKLISRKYPFLPLSIHVRVSNRKHFELDTQALIDTGFSGDIVVPVTEELKQAPPDAYATWTMADGSEDLAQIAGRLGLNPETLSAILKEGGEALE